MTRIIVKNGDWDKARAELSANMGAKKNAFDAKLASAFQGTRKPADAEPAAKSEATPATGKPVLSRSRRF